MAKPVIVEVDTKGRVQIPSSIRRELKSRRFTLSIRKGRLLMDPVKPATTIRGKYKRLLKASIEEIEEAQDQFVASNHRTKRAYTSRRAKQPIKEDVGLKRREAVMSEWKSIKNAVEKKMEKYGPTADEEIADIAQKNRHGKRPGS